MSLVILLSLCVLMQMLGVPASMLEPAGSFDLVESSLLEGWSIHVRHVFAPPRSGSTSTADMELLVNVPILARVFFRPPLR